MSETPGIDTDLLRAVAIADPKSIYGQGVILQLCDLVAALRLQLAEAQRPIPCGVCGGRPLASGRPCICGGHGTEQAEMHGLRVALFDAEKEIETLSTQLAARSTPERGDPEGV